jgi:hypothetical protein
VICCRWIEPDEQHLILAGVPFTPQCVAVSPAWRQYRSSLHSVARVMLAAT